VRKQYRQLSIGQKRRVHLVLALCRKPQVLILDEPTAGIDALNRAELHNEIRKARLEGMTILLAAHDMTEAENLITFTVMQTVVYWKNESRNPV
jgi:ABC-2 type transport system ATP-binding protein